jgi:hypothetical protein
MQEEIWKDIPNYEGLYQVSNLGRVKSLFRKIYNKNNEFIYTQKEIILKQSYDKSGYYRIALTNNSERKRFKIHQLVAMAFLGHKPCGFKLVVDHINDIKTDNRVENLQIVTSRYNTYKTQGKYSSQYKGVFLDKKRNKWIAKIIINNKQTHLGIFINEYDAHLAYEKKVSELNHRPVKSRI